MPTQNTGENTHRPILRSRDLPRFVFLNENGAETRLEPGASTARIRAVSYLIGQRLEKGSVVGLMYPSGPELVINWLASVLAGMRPLVMQYHTEKQSRPYWADSVTHTIGLAHITAIICDDASVSLLDGIAATISQHELNGMPDAPPESFELDEFTIVQLSSGTTGHRKAIAFDGKQLLRHVEAYNSVMQLTSADRIVSWLPLYHDMGYVACFIMPMIMGVDVVMMDAMIWIRQPSLLFAAIKRYRGTLCYMPNFGFEVMSRLGSDNLTSMRWWVSCSEPVAAATARKFLTSIGAAEETFAPCYAMAENVFAVSMRRGLRTHAIGGAEVVSCGRPIPGVEIKVVDEELWIRSPTSFTSYLEGDTILDDDGYYPSGDLGEIAGGEVYVTGRKQDLIIQAGRKYMLSDIDLALNTLFPWVRGRAVAVPVYDQRLGTETATVLIESKDFFHRADEAEIAGSLQTCIGLDQVSVRFVPPRFLTKTSSGKFNRKASAADWALTTGASGRRPVARSDPLGELTDSFEHLNWDLPIENALDSLSLELLRIILTGAGVAADHRRTLKEIRGHLVASTTAAGPPIAETIRIVSLADRGIFRRLKERHVDRLSALLGRPVVFEHLCMPPLPILLSDLIFHDYFQPRLDQKPFVAVSRGLETLKTASLIVVDDIAEMYYPPGQIYGALSHGLERDTITDLILVRWARFAASHDQLPLTMVAGIDLPQSQRTAILDLLSLYLATPLFKIATIKGYDKDTQGWDYRPLGGSGGERLTRMALDPDVFVDTLAQWARERELKRYPATNSAKLEMSDLAHFCSHLGRKDTIDKVLAKYSNFCIVGQKSSAPYIPKELTRQGKTYFYLKSYAPEVVGSLTARPDCVLICGSQGEHELDLPTVAIMKASRKWKVQNIDDPDLHRADFVYGRGSKKPPSRTDWFYPFALDPKIREQVEADAAEVIAQARREKRNRKRRLRRRPD